MKLPLAALLVSAAALAAALAALRAARSRPEGPAAAQVATAPEVRQPEAGGGTASPPPVQPPPDDARLNALSERIDRLEEKLQELDRRSREPKNRAGDETVDAAALEAVILDRVRTPAERVAALKKMRLRAPQARTIEVARAMIDLLRTCEDATVRAEICRQLFGLDYPEIGEAMLTRLRTDSDEKTREEAAETLETFGDEPGVMQALEYAKEHDESAAVREQAVKTIAEIRAR
ncbi:MAG: HEAT repeat domain-containing protein [Planctomycetia bacterium]|nr:HEAT repeat domain-containing protein [Planctomycetia bacterium]